MEGTLTGRTYALGRCKREAVEMGVWTIKAEYRAQVLPEYQGNPLIESLPDILSANDTMRL